MDALQAVKVICVEFTKAYTEERDLRDQLTAAYAARAGAEGRAEARASYCKSGPDYQRASAILPVAHPVS